MRKTQVLFFYGIFGVLTTVINFAVYVGLTRMFDFSVVVSSMAAWFVSVLFAYVTNKLFVFRIFSCDNLWTELLMFCAGRCFTGVLDVVLLYILAHISHINDLYIKMFVNIVVVVINYIFGKTLFLERKDDHERSKTY